MADDERMPDPVLNLRLTAGIVEAFVASNRLPPGDVAQLISPVHRAFAGLVEGMPARPLLLRR